MTTAPLDRDLTLPPPAALNFPLRRRLMMVAMGYIPFANGILFVALLLLTPRGATWVALGWLLLVPPIVVRITLRCRPLPQADIPLGSADFMRWWFTAQWQVIFNRLPWIEETIRLVPGLYSAWLRLWGARVGRFVYWTPGLRILDRSLVDVGDRVVFGAGVKLNPHIILPDAAGRLVLKAATVRIGSDAMVGGYSLLTCGSWIAPGEASPGWRDFRPFTGWENGHRVGSAAGNEAHDA
jgi:hypothetical protein